MFKSIFKKAAVSVIKGLLWLLDSDHRNKEEISPDNMKKFTHIVEHDFQSDFGKVSRAFRTVPYEVWELRTKSKRLLAADKHRVIREDHSCVWLEDLKPGDRIKTDVGIEEVISSRSLGIRTHMYCVEVNTEKQDDPYNHLYYTDGILSHNTTCAAAYLLWKAMFTPDATILVCANKAAQALEIMQRIRYSYENLPDYIRAGVTEYNKGNISFDNGSRIVSRATTPDAGRGLSITTLYIDEFAFVPPRMAKEFWTSIRPVLSTGGSCIITSTPKNDEDQFATIWKGAIDNTDEYGNENPSGLGKNDFKAIKITWAEHPDRNKEWEKTEREQLGDAKFEQEHNCNFISDDETLINPMLLARMTYKQPVFFTGTVRWYSEPLPNRSYLVSLDPSLGTGSDSAALQVYRLPDMEQVAEWQHNKSAPPQQMRVLINTLKFLEGTLLEHPEQMSAPEIFWTFENNTIGEAILQIIEDTGEDNFPGMLVSERKRKGTTRRFRKGMNTTNKNKLSACARMKSLIETNRMKVNSQNLIKELKNFVSAQSTFKAKSGENDDLVTSSLLSVRMLDVVLHWGITHEGDLKEVLNSHEDDAMPVVL